MKCHETITPDFLVELNNQSGHIAEAYSCSEPLDENRDSRVLGMIGTATTHVIVTELTWTEPTSLEFTPHRPGFTSLLSASSSASIEYEFGDAFSKTILGPLADLLPSQILGSLDVRSSLISAILLRLMHEALYPGSPQEMIIESFGHALLVECAHWQQACRLGNFATINDLALKKGLVLIFDSSESHFKQKYRISKASGIALCEDCSLKFERLNMAYHTKAFRRQRC